VGGPKHPGDRRRIPEGRHAGFHHVADSRTRCSVPRRRTRSCCRSRRPCATWWRDSPPRTTRRHGTSARPRSSLWRSPSVRARNARASTALVRRTAACSLYWLRSADQWFGHCQDSIVLVTDRLRGPILGAGGRSAELAGTFGAFTYESLGDLRGAFLGNGNRTVLGGYRHHCREYSPHHVRPAGSRVVVRGIVERLHRRAHRGIGPGIRIVQLLQCTAGEHGPGTNGVVTGMLLVAPAGHVERHDPPPTLGVLGVDVVPDEQRYGGESGHRGLQVALHHGGQLVGFAVQGQRDTLDLLVVRQLHCAETYQFQGDTRGTRDPDSRILVSNVHLLQIPRRDQIATGGPPVAGDEYTAVERRRNDRRTVRGLEIRRNLPALPATGQQLGRLFPQEISERRRRRRQMSAAERRARGIGSVVHACSCLPICSNGMAVVFSNTGRRQPASRGEEGSL